jgi:hypothetical protein
MKKAIASFALIAAMCSAKAQLVNGQVLYEDSHMKVWCDSATGVTNPNPNYYLIRSKSKNTCNHWIDVAWIMPDGSTGGYPVGIAVPSQPGIPGFSVHRNCVSFTVCFRTSSCGEVADCSASILNAPPVLILPVKFEYIKLSKKTNN